MTTPTNITGVILAGGRGARMGGVDKGLVSVVGKPLVEHVIERIAPQVNTLLINANRSHAAYARYGYPVIRDAVIEGLEEYAGPLAGMLSALQHARTEWVLVVPCDAPKLPLHLATHLYAQRKHARACIAHDGLRAHPACALLSIDLHDELRAALLRGERKTGQWLHSIGCCVADFSTAVDAFVNVNTVEDARRLKRDN